MATTTIQSSSTLSGGIRHNRHHHRPCLELVFDINKTILIDDPSGGKDEYKLLNEILSENAWGKFFLPFFSWTLMLTIYVLCYLHT